MGKHIKRVGCLKCFPWCLLVSLLLLGQTGRADATGHTVDEETGVEIVTVAEEAMFPDNWTRSANPPRATALNAHSSAYPAEIVQQELHKYPSAFVKANLKSIYLVHDLIYNGVSLGGLNWLEAKRIYIAVGDMDFTNAVGWLQGTLHHEFAHLLAGNHRRNFRALDWMKLNSHDYHYGSGFVDAIRRGKGGDGYTISEDYLQKGFIREYSMASVAEDFATLCEHLLPGDPALQEATEKYGVIRHKVEAAKRFYASLDPLFTEDYFAGLEQQHLRDIVLTCLGTSIEYHNGRQQLNVMEDTLASRGGLKSGDLLISVSDIVLKEAPAPRGTISSLPQNSKIVVTLQRSGMANTLSVALETNFSLWQQSTAPESVEMPFGGMYLPAYVASATRKLIQVKPGSRVMVNPEGSFYILYPDPSGKPSF